jgi:hypothetical protein
MVVQRPIAVVNVIHIHEKDNRVMPKASPTQLLSSILQWRHPFFEIFGVFLMMWRRIRLKELKLVGDQKPANGKR